MPTSIRPGRAFPPRRGLDSRQAGGPGVADRAGLARPQPGRGGESRAVLLDAQAGLLPQIAVGGLPRPDERAPISPSTCRSMTSRPCRELANSMTCAVGPRMAPGEGGLLAYARAMIDLAPPPPASAAPAAAHARARRAAMSGNAPIPTAARTFPAHRPGGDHAGPRRRRPLPAGAPGEWTPGLHSTLAGFVEPGESAGGRGRARGVRRRSAFASRTSTTTPRSPGRFRPR